MFNVGWATGEFVSAVSNWFILDFRLMIIFVVIPVTLVSTYFNFFILIESPRYYVNIDEQKCIELLN